MEKESPETNIDEDLEVDEESAENVSGGHGPLAHTDRTHKKEHGERF